MIEQDITIRKSQITVALEMMSPSSGKNSVLQLNMGEGKSSVIIPIVAAALANGQRLLRVVVLRSLGAQMYDLLASKLGRLLNRQVYFMPFSRGLNLDAERARRLQGLFEECMTSGGVILTLPEYTLSFQLMCPEKMLKKQFDAGRCLLKSQEWLRAHSRDILDESDEILGVRFELMYSIGSPALVDHHPYRWIIIQYVLKLFAKAVDLLFAQDTPNIAVDYRFRTDSFPIVQITDPELWRQITDTIARQICRGDSEVLPIWKQTQEVKNILVKFITGRPIWPQQRKFIEDYLSESDLIRRSILVVKGMIADGILVFVLRDKRWRVNYGLDLSRTSLSVPYKAKDTPDQRSSWSHTDAAITMTCLSYYYGGLSDQQLFATLKALTAQDNGPEEYARWVSDHPDIPEEHRQLSGVNLTHLSVAASHLFPALRFSKPTIDYYLCQVVFPKEIREFPSKLSLSAWDIAGGNNHLTTGFSGTNDSRYVLPLSIAQQDLPEEQHTNASVLVKLLQPQNQYIGLESLRHTSEVNDAAFLIRTIAEADPPIRVLIDVGAQILELRNEEVAHAWLRQVSTADTDGVVYFNDDNQMMVLDRHGCTELLATSPLYHQLGKCLIYLDESHTRGTDLKLPRNYRAAILLGPKLAKDRLTQGSP